jgi:adenosylmethionine-8-amino-7-oxononanoate aminotransferase
MANNFFYKAPNYSKGETVLKGKGSYIYFKNKKKKYLDFTSGRSTLMCLGYSNRLIISEIKKQLLKYPHIDCNVFNNDLAEIVSNELIKFKPRGLDKVYFSGSSGSDAIEAAMKLSHQVHIAERKNNKNIFISRKNSYHGGTLGAISVSNFYKHRSYKNILPKNTILIPEYNYFEKCNSKKNKKCKCGKKHSYETISEYTHRSVKFLENAIKKYDKNKISAFIGSTQLSVGQGHSQPAKNYWQLISSLCKKNNIHLILDEIYCGGGRSGDYFNFNNYKASPDFVCIGKNFTAGYAPLSAVITKNKFQKLIKNNQGEFFHAHTFQGYALGLAAAYGTIKYIRENNILNKVKKDSEYILKKIDKCFSGNKNFVTVRGIGLHLSIEYNFNNTNKFVSYFTKEMFKKNIIVNCMPKFINLSPTYILSKKEIDYFIESMMSTFLKYKDN